MKSLLLSGCRSMTMCLPNCTCSLAFKPDSRALNEQKTQQKPCLKCSRRMSWTGIMFKDIRIFFLCVSFKSDLKRFRWERVKSWTQMNKVICNFFMLQKAWCILLHVLAMAKNWCWKGSKFHFGENKATV